VRAVFNAPANAQIAGQYSARASLEDNSYDRWNDISGALGAGGESVLGFTGAGGLAESAAADTVLGKAIDSPLTALSRPVPARPTGLPEPSASVETSSDGPVLTWREPSSVEEVSHDVILPEVSGSVLPDGGTPALEGTPYSPDVVNARSAKSYSLYGDNPLRGTMSNVEARQWYLDQDARIPESLDSSASLEDQARQAFDFRNANRTDARELMSDRIAADRLYREEPNRSWEKLIDYRRSTGLSDEQVYQSIIDSSQKTRTSVNKQLGLD
jgi:filamentous hemagglutinin